MNKNSDIRVRFGDLISELNKNFDCTEYSIITTMGDNGSKSLKEVLNKYNLESYYQRMIVSIKGNNFNYRFFLPFRIDDIDINGRLLLEHLDVNVANNGKKNSIYSTVVVSKDIDDVILNIDDTVLNRCEDINFYPSEVFKNAVNCLSIKKKVKRK